MMLTKAPCLGSQSTKVSHPMEEPCFYLTEVYWSSSDYLSSGFFKGRDENRRGKAGAPD